MMTTCWGLTAAQAVDDCCGGQVGLAAAEGLTAAVESDQELAFAALTADGVSNEG
jgi:hypothetical protein